SSQNYCNPDPNAGQCLILWRYKVLFVKRDLEHAFKEVEDLVPDDVSDITPWKIAEFIQLLGSAKHDVEVPEKWIKEGYAKDYWRVDEKGKGVEAKVDMDQIHKLEREKRSKIYLTGLPEDDKQYLRLYREELARYTRQEPKYEEQKIKVLKEIRDKIK